MTRKTIIGILTVPALVVLFLAMSWIDGASVRARLARADQLLTSKVPFFKVTQRKETAGLFQSTVEVTYELNDKLFKGMAAATTKQTAYIVDPAPLATATPPSFTLRHHIQHGPMPGYTTLGLARVDTEFVLSEKTRLELRQHIGTDHPLKIVTLLGYFGGGTTTIESPAVDFTNERDSTHFHSLGIKGRLHFTRGLDSQDGNITLLGMTVKDEKGGNMDMGPMRIDYDLKRAFEVLFVGKASLTMDHMSVAMTQPTGPGNMEMRDVAYEVATTANGDFLDTAAKIGVGSMSIATIKSMGVHYDFALRHMHGPTYAAFSEKLREIYANVLDGDTKAPQQMQAAIKEYGAQLLEQKPELTIDRISISTPEGTAQLSGKASMPGYAHGDLEYGPMVLLPKIQASADMSVDEGFLNRDWGPTTPAAAAPVTAPQGGRRPNGKGAAMMAAPPPSRAEAMKAQLAAMEQQGFVIRHGTQLTSHLEFNHGALTVNGKPVGPPAGAGR